VIKFFFRHFVIRIQGIRPYMDLQLFWSPYDQVTHLSSQEDMCELRPLLGEVSSGIPHAQKKSFHRPAEGVCKRTNQQMFRESIELHRGGRLY